MGRRFIAMFVVTAVLGAGLAQAGQGLSKFSVESEAPKAGADPGAALKTPQGVACPLGIAQVKALDGDRFEYAGKPYKGRDLAKALRRANKPKQFDCVVIEGGKPPSVQGMTRVVKDLSTAPVNHVEWSGARPDVPTMPSKK